jgi:hypothetical protein
MFGTNAGKTIRNRLANLRHSVAGAIDLASIMVGVIVLGVIASVIAATVFVVIPWAQDNAAKGDLGAVREAQSVARVQEGSFLTVPQLVEKGYLPSGTTASGDVGVTTASVGAAASVGTLFGSVNAAGDCYLAASTSATGNIFYTTSKSVDIHQYVKEVSVSDCGSISGLISPAIMVSLWDTSISGCATITLPVSGAVTGTINWGDGVTAPLTVNPAHAYTGAAGVKTVTIEGTFAGWGAASGWTPTCVTEVTAWAGTETSSLDLGFYNAANLTAVAETPVGVTTMYGMLFSAPKFNGTVLGFNTSKVTDMSYMFGEATVFNQPVSFSTESVTNMELMFYNASAFNQPVAFDTAEVTNMANMFSGASAFNQPVTFNTSTVTGMGGMFNGASAFNQPVAFNTSNVTNMGSMFRNAYSFNQPVDFDSRNVTSMANMFEGATLFNQPVAFDTSNVIYMGQMFRNATAFNKPVAFDSRNVTDMASMFRNATAFNKPVTLNTSLVTGMGNMFNGATMFNQPLVFNTSNVTYMGSMFVNASAFNQDLNGWNVNKVAGWSPFRTNSALTDANTPDKFR